MRNPRTISLSASCSFLAALTLLMVLMGPRQATGADQALTYVSSAPLSSQLTTASITDPTLNNMLAARVTIPAGWSLQGIEMISPCTTAPWPVFRAFSPDGLMQLHQEPLVGWQWNSSGKQLLSSCAPLTSVISAVDFLRYYMETMQGGIHVVGPMPVPAAFSKWAQNMAEQFNQFDARGPAMLRAQHTADSTALRVQVVNGSVVIEERLVAAVECGVRSNNQPNDGGNCWARLDVFMAPQGKLDVLAALADRNDLPHWEATPEWKQATLTQLSQKNALEGAARLAQGRAESQAFSNMMYNAFQQNMARSAAQHQAFMQQQEAQFRSSMNHAIGAMNARSTAASDWVDYALDQKTVTGPGGTVKVSSAYSQTWTNGQGQWYQTNIPNANPNGVLQGNWTQTTQVHGNGQP